MPWCKSKYTNEWVEVEQNEKELGTHKTRKTTEIQKAEEMEVTRKNERKKKDS